MTSKYPGCSVSISPSTCFSNFLFSNACTYDSVNTGESPWAMNASNTFSFF
ncbi:hypothetical protein LEP1GSC019_1646 [Leptospira interrogans serovar Pyrogenes str. 2006006960]|nr:hypothetical protein LEP1GSC019_1646 [Leptospira interrogans serovar Pyrogenes str. 2006006960]